MKYGEVVKDLASQLVQMTEILYWNKGKKKKHNVLKNIIVSMRISVPWSKHLPCFWFIKPGDLGKISKKGTDCFNSLIDEALFIC